MASMRKSQRNAYISYMRFFFFVFFQVFFTLTGCCKTSTAKISFSLNLFHKVHRSSHINDSFISKSKKDQSLLAPSRLMTFLYYFLCFFRYVTVHGRFCYFFFLASSFTSLYSCLSLPTSF